MCDVVPCVVGVPLIPPLVVFNDRLARRDGETDHVYGGVPPEHLTVAEYAWLTVPAGSEDVLIVELPGGLAGGGVPFKSWVDPLSPQAVTPKR